MKRIRKFIGSVVILTAALSISHASLKRNIEKAGDIVLLSKGKIVYKPKKSKKSKEIISTAKKYLGTRYKYGGTNLKRGIDCSAFVQKVYRQHGKKLPRTSSSQASAGKHVARKDLKKGDLVFFSTSSSKRIGHVGIFIGGSKFIHASSGAKKVTITSLNNKYYKHHYKGARRV